MRLYKLALAVVAMAAMLATMLAPAPVAAQGLSLIHI